MADQDYAILLGISRYAFSNEFQSLKGPTIDVALFRRWLMKKNGGDVPKTNIQYLVSPCPGDQPADLKQWAPTADQFLNRYDDVTIDKENNDFIRRKGRLYLYFSGHGFSEQNDLATGAALFVAGACNARPQNIHGTAFAGCARDLALFEEIVLIMDCCRDAKTTLKYASPGVNKITSEIAGDVRLLAIYGAAKGGQAQERKIGQRTSSLLTHALLNALSNAPPDAGNKLSSTALRLYIRDTWAALCGEVPADAPNFVLPEGDDIYFNAGQNTPAQGFVLSTPPMPGTVLIFYRGSLDSPVAQCVFQSEFATVESPIGSSTEPLPIVNLRFTLNLQPGFYKVQASMGSYSSAPFEVKGERDVAL